MLAEMDRIDLTSQTASEIKLVITDSGHHAEDERNELFKKKVTTYANYIKSPKFREDFQISGKTVVIELISPVAPSARMLSLMKSVMGLPAKDQRFNGMNILVHHKAPAGNQATAPTRPAGGGGSAANTTALMKGPSLIFILVAAADGNIDKKEVKAFMETLVAAEEFGRRCPVLGKALEPENALNGINDYMERIGREPDFNPVKELEILSAAADSALSADHCEAYKMGLLFIGKHIAEASGGFLGFLGSKISKDEKMALGMIVHTLNVEKYLGD